MELNKSVRKYILELYVQKNLISPLNEQVPAASRAVFTGLNTAYKTRINDKLGKLLTRRGKDVDGFIVGKSNKGTPVQINVNNGKEFFNNFIAGTLTDRDAELVFKEIFKSLDEDSVIEPMADYIIKNNIKFVSRYKNKPRESISAELQPIYGKKQAEVLAKKIHSRPLGRNILKILDEAWGQAWQTPSLIKVISKLRGSVNGEKSWKLFTRWLLTGTTRPLVKDANVIYRNFINNGASTEQAIMFTRLLISLPMEVLQRWLILNGTVTFLKIVKEYATDVYIKKTGKKGMDQSTWDLAVSEVKKNWPDYPWSWVWPAGAIANSMWIIIDGIVRDTPAGEIIDNIMKGSLPVQRELQQIENQVDDYTFDPIKGKIE